jgi:hypothetical protein
MRDWELMRTFPASSSHEIRENIIPTACVELKCRHPFDSKQNWKSSEDRICGCHAKRFECSTDRSYIWNYVPVPADGMLLRHMGKHSFKNIWSKQGNALWLCSAATWLQQGCTNPGRQMVAMATKFCTVALTIYVSSVRNLVHVTILAPRFYRWLSDFWKICGTPGLKNFRSSSWVSPRYSDYPYSTFQVILDIYQQQMTYVYITFK